MSRCLAVQPPAILLAMILAILVASVHIVPAWSQPSVARVAEKQDSDLQVEVTKKGLGKEVSIRKGDREWFMLIEVTIDNTVVVRQEKQNDTYLVDESETHDRALSSGEVDAAIEDFINSVKQRIGRSRK
jgi:hypothetical protein